MTGWDLTTSIFNLLYMIVALVVVFILPGWLILRKYSDLSRLELVWAAILVCSAHWTILALILAPLQFHDVPGLLVVSGLAALIYLAIMQRVDLVQMGIFWYHKSLAVFLDVIEIPRLLQQLCISFWLMVHRRVNVRAMILKMNMARILVWIVFIYGACYRFIDPVTHYSFAYYDPFVHIVWLKEFNYGHIFYDGVYPRGYHAFLSVLCTFSALNPVIIIRFIGAAFGSLLAPALYFFLTECGVSWGGALVGASLLTMGTPFNLPGFVERQMAALPEEFGLVFALVALGFAVRYLRLGNNRDRLLVFAGGFIVWGAHSITGAIYTVAGIAILIDAWRRHVSKERILLLVREVTLSVVAGNLYLMVGVLTGHPLHAASMRMVEMKAEDIAATMSPIAAMITNLGLLSTFLMGCSILLTLYGLTSRRMAFPSPAVVGLWGQGMVALWAVKALYGIFTPIPPERVAMIIPFAACGVVAWFYSLMLEPLMGRWSRNIRFHSGFICLIIGVLFTTFIVPPPKPPRPEFEEAAKLYYRLMAHAPTGSWTIVGQAEEYQLVLGTGSHMTPAHLISNYPATSPNPEFPTPYTYIIVEKRPKKGLPQNEEERSRQADEAVLADWVQVYAHYHDDIRLYREDKNVAIYLIYQPQAVLRYRSKNVVELSGAWFIV